MTDGDLDSRHNLMAGIAKDLAAGISPASSNHSTQRSVQELRPPPDFTGVPLSLEQWEKRSIEPKQNLLGELLSTTSRALLSADTGLGKTHFSMAIGLAMAAGEAFCHWAGHGGRPRILYIDGEMSRELMQERLADAERRLGRRVDTFFCLCREDVEDMPPLDTQEGADWLGHLISYMGGVDFIIFDNISALTTGNLADPESWLPMREFNRSLTRQRIGILWINHTGHDTTRDYGPRMRQWDMDVTMVAEKIENDAADIAFTLKFPKARQRKPSNWSDFEPVEIRLEGDQWTSTAAKHKAKSKRLGGNQQILINALESALQQWGEPSPGFSGMPTTGTVVKLSHFESLALNILPQSQTKYRNQAYRDSLKLLIAEKVIGKHGDYTWRMDK